MADLNVDSVRVSVLGGLHAQTDDGPVRLPRSRKARALLAYLAASDMPCRKASVCDILFSTTSDPSANLRWCLSRLRSAFHDTGKQLFCSDSENVWLGCEANNVDIRRLRAIRERRAFGDEEFTFLESQGRQQFLPGLEVSSSPDYETWRATMQVHLERLLEETLEEAIELNGGSELSLRYAELLTECAPYSENAWSLLISSLQKVNRTHHARRFLKIATSQLRGAGVVQTGLLAKASTELNAVEARSVAVQAETLNTSSSAEQLMILSILPIDFGAQADEAMEEFGEALVSAAAVNKTIALASDDQDTPADLSLATRIRKRKNRYLIDVKLNDQRTGVCRTVWQKEIAFSPLSEMIEELRSWLGAKFEIDLLIQLIAVAQSKPEERWSASDCMYLALPKIYSPAGYAVHEATSLLRQSLRIDPNYAPALCGMAWVRSTHPLYNQSQEERQKTTNMARRSLELAYDNAFVLGWAAVTIGHMECNPRAGLIFADRAVELNEYSPFARLGQGVLRHYTGDFDGSLETLHRLQQSRVEPIAFICDTYIALNMYQNGRYEEAIRYCQSAIDKNPGYIVTYRALIPALVRIGSIEKARPYAKQLVEMDSSETLDYFRRYLPYSDKAAKRRLINDLAEAGVPDKVKSQ